MPAVALMVGVRDEGGGERAARAVGDGQTGRRRIDGGFDDTHSETHRCPGGRGPRAARRRRGVARGDHAEGDVDALFFVVARAGDGDGRRRWGSSSAAWVVDNVRTPSVTERPSADSTVLGATSGSVLGAWAGAGQGQAGHDGQQ